MTDRRRDNDTTGRRWRPVGLAIATWLVLVAAAPSQAHRCVGDCDASDTVSVGELILGVRIALAQASIFACVSYDADFDRRVSVDELLVAVNNAFSNCGHGIATATPAGAATPTADETPPLPADAAAW
jgi:hypothetical protein